MSEVLNKSILYGAVIPGPGKIIELFPNCEAMAIEIAGDPIFLCGPIPGPVN